MLPQHNYQRSDPTEEQSASKFQRSWCNCQAPSGKNKNAWTGLASESSRKRWACSIMAGTCRCCCRWSSVYGEHKRSTLFLALCSPVICLNVNLLERLLIIFTKCLKQCARFLMLTHFLNRSLWSFPSSLSTDLTSSFYHNTESYKNIKAVKKNHHESRNDVANLSRYVSIFTSHQCQTIYYRQKIA